MSDHPKPNVLTARLAREAVLLDLAQKKYFQLNDSASVAWDALAEGASPDEVVRRLLATFDVPEAEARAAVETLLATLRAHGLLTPPPANG